MDSGKFWRRRLRSLISYALLFFVVTASVRCRRSRRATTGVATLEAFPRRRAVADGRLQAGALDADQQLAANGDGLVVAEAAEPVSLDLRQEPTELTIVADGAQLWIYDVELAQVTVTPFDDTRRREPRDAAERRPQRARGVRGRAERSTPTGSTGSSSSRSAARISRRSRSASAARRRGGSSSSTAWVKSLESSSTISSSIPRSPTTCSSSTCRTGVNVIGGEG